MKRAMNGRRGALLAALLVPVLVSGAGAQSATVKPKTIVFPTEWHEYQNWVYCYSVKLPVDAVLDTTDPARIRVTMTRTGNDPKTGRVVTPKWVFWITATPNPKGVSVTHWVEPGSDTPDASSGLAEITEIMRRRDFSIDGHKAIRKQVEGSGERRDACFVAHGAYMYGLSYPVVDVDNQSVLQDELPTFYWVIEQFQFADPARCKVTAAGP